jgi:hypothetical protein
VGCARMRREWEGCCAERSAAMRSANRRRRYTVWGKLLPVATSPRIGVLPLGRRMQRTCCEQV